MSFQNGGLALALPSGRSWPRESAKDERGSMIETRLSLLQRVCNFTDQKSWREFAALYEPLLLAYVRKQGIAGENAADVVQSVFVALLRSLPRFDRTKGRFRTWLWRIAHNALIDFWRRERTIRGAEEGRRRQTTEEAPEPEQEWNTLHHQRILQFAMEQVRDETVLKTWKCFEEHLFKGRPGPEVGRELDLPANTVYVNASRVLTRIRERCASYREDLGDD